MNSEILASAFLKHKHEVCVLTWSRDTGEKKFPFSVIRDPSYKKILELHSWADVVLENNPCLRLSWPGLLFGRPSVVVLNTWLSKGTNNRLQEVLKLLWLRRAKKVIAVSHAVRRGIWPAATVIVNPYRKNLFKNLPDVKKTEDFVFLGRLVSDKGVDLAIRAIQKLKKIIEVDKDLGVKPNLTIIGEGEERENLVNLVDELDLQDNVDFKGPLIGEELVHCLNQHRFIIIPSTWEEPFGIVALEGMACGCLPIASNGGGLPEAIGRAGILFRKGDLDELITRILEVLRNSEMEHQYRSQIKTHLAYHQANIVTKRYLEVIEDAVFNE